MDEFPALIQQPRDISSRQTNQSFSSIAGSHLSNRELLRRESDFTPDDFPALSRPQIMSRTNEEMASFMSRDFSGLSTSSNTTFPNQTMVQQPQQIMMTRKSNNPQPIGTIQKMSNQSSAPPNLSQHNFNSNQFESNNPNQSTTSNEDTFNLLGLLDIIKMSNQDKTMVALGLDLTTLGLSLSANDALYTSFMSPYAVDPCSGAEPVFELPDCYNTSFFIPPLLSKIKSFSDDSLFYIFYTMLRDISQEAAAQQLYTRGWRYHKELRLWLTKDQTTETIVKGAGFERGIFIFFDPVNWNRVKKEFVLHYDLIEKRGLLEPTNEPEKPSGHFTNNFTINTTQVGPSNKTTVPWGSSQPSSEFGDAR